MIPARIRLPSDIAAALLLFLCIALIILTLQNPTSLDDGLRHMAMAMQMRTLGILQVPGWSTFLYEGYFSSHPVDPWFLSDVLLIPFTYFPLAKGLQLFVLFEVICLFAAFLLIIRSLKLPATYSVILLLILVFGDTQFMGRFLLGRPYALMTAVALCVIYTILEKRWILVAFLLMLGVLLSQLFVFSLLFCLCGITAFLLQKKRREALFLGSAMIAGTGLGFLLHPQPLGYLQYLLTAFLRIPFLQFVGLSREMQSGLTDNAFFSLLVVMTVGILCLCSLLRLHSREWLQKRFAFLFLTICSVLPVLGFLIWVRAIDLAWPLLLLWFASILVLDPSLLQQLQKSLLPKKSIATQILLYACIAGCIAEILVLPYIMIRDDKARSLQPYEALQIIPSHSRVLNLDWENFFAYVAVRPDLQYAAGIDRSFTYMTDPEISEIIYALEPGQSVMYPDIQKSMNTVLSVYRSDYLVVSHRKFEPVIQALKMNQAFSLLSDNGTIAIYAVPDWYRSLK